MDEPVDVVAEEELEKEELEETEETEETEESLDSEVPEEEDEELDDEELEELDLEEEDEEEFVEAKKRRKEDEVDEDIVEERFYTIPLSKAWIVPRKKRAPKAARIVRSFVLKHMKVRTEAEGEEEPERLVIDNEVNEKLWSRGIEKPPRKIKVRVVKDNEGVITVLLAEGD
ncbi:MAG TPA: 50S ribosomal protein L31e [Acidobacteriota bacterium]|nr:50S ribosomal protein L31e [Acidobacteriota bacterium]